MNAPECDADLDMYFAPVLQQHGPLLRAAEAQEGPGVAVFDFFAAPKPNGANCQFRYCEKGGCHWDFLAGRAPAAAQAYAPERHLLIAAVVPVNTYNSEKVCSVRLYDKATGERVAVADETADATSPEKA